MVSVRFSSFRQQLPRQLSYTVVISALLIAEHVCVCVFVVCSKQAEIGIILDQSSNIVDPSRGGYDNWDVSVHGFVTDLISAFPIGPQLTRVGIVGMSSNAWLEFGFDRYHNTRDMIRAVEEIEIRGGETNIAQVPATNCDISEEFHHGTMDDLLRVVLDLLLNSSVCLFSFCIVTVYMYVPGMLIMNYY